MKEEVITYTYTFDMNLSKKDFYNAVDDYCTLLMNMNGFYYEEAFSIDQYNESGLLTEYFSRDNIAIGVTASVEAVGWFVYIDIYDLSFESNPAEEGDSEILYNNYSYYLEGRESINYDLATKVQMENGIAFYLNEAVVIDLGDGTSQIDCNMYIGATYDDTYLYTDSFIVLPMDRDGFIIGDACVTNNIADEMGQYQYVPYLLSTNDLYTYTLSFIVPSETTSFTVYGTNLIDGFVAGPVYGINMVVEE